VNYIDCLKDITTQINDCTLIGNHGYLSVKIQLNLFRTCNIEWNIPIRNNQRNNKKTLYFLIKKEN
jgi:hypothetical protein